MPRTLILCSLWATALTLGSPLAPACSGQTVWSGFSVSFSKPLFADPSLPANQDQITDNVWITRGTNQGLYNARVETGYVAVSPADTEWATSLMPANAAEAIAASNWQDLTFDDWVTAYGGMGSGALPGNLLANNAVVHLITDDIYLDLRFTGWSGSGGSFSYERAAPIPEPNSATVVLTALFGFSWRSRKQYRQPGHAPRCWASLAPAGGRLIDDSCLKVQRYSNGVSRMPSRLFLCALLWTAAIVSPCWAITLGHVDNFNDGTTQGWGVGAPVPGGFPVNQPDLGQSGAGDHALWMATEGAGGNVPNLLVFNTSTNWRGNWTSAGVSRIELDVRDPGSNNFTLAIRLGIVGPRGGPSSGGGGDTYVTDAMPVPSDGQWHRLTFDVSPSSFFPTGGTDIDDALADVRHFRILHNPLQSFSGATTIGGGEFYLDNIQALSAMEPPSTTGDYNGNGVVDAADYVVWRKTLNQTVPEPGDGADGNRSGVIDQGDYDFWRMQFGDIVPVPVSGSGHIAAVPEPATNGLLLFATILALGRGPRN